MSHFYGALAIKTGQWTLLLAICIPSTSSHFSLKYILILSFTLYCYMAGGGSNDRMALKERMLEEDDWIYLLRDGFM
jgi:hypothetical protein